MNSKPKEWRERLAKTRIVEKFAPLKLEIAEYLGISPQAFSRYVKQGCPTTSYEAARAWQKKYIDPSQRMFNSRESRERDKRARERWQAGLNKRPSK